MEEKSFNQQVLSIAIPVALQNLIVSMLNTLDTMMISSLGDAAIAGVGLANQLFFVFTFICFGINTGSSVIISQYWGKRDRRNVQRVNSLALILSIVLASIFTLVGFAFPRQLISLMIQDPAVVEAGATYLGVAIFSYIVTAISFSLASTLRSTGNPRTPLVASIISFFANAFFNYVFIFGKFGFPEFGVAGAAIGTIIARIIELTIIVYVIHSYDGPLRGSLKSSLDFDGVFVRKYFVTALPVIVNETFWSLGQVMYNVAYAMIGTEAVAATQVCVAIQNIVFVIVRGLGNAASIMIGNKIGQGFFEEVYQYAVRFLKLALVTGVLIGLIVALTPDYSLSLFGNLSPTVREIAIRLLRVMGLVFIVKAMTSVIVVGILRGGGDTKFAMFLDMGTSWLIGVPLAFMGAALFQWPIHYVVALVSLEEVVKAMIGLHRVKTKAWIRNVT